MTNTTHTIRDAVRALVDDLGSLVGKEFELAKAEAHEKADQVQTGVVSVLFGMLVGLCTLIVLTEAVVAALSNVVPPSLAAASVGIVLAAIAFVAIRTGEAHLRPRNLAPTRTLHSVSEQASKIKESMQ